MDDQALASSVVGDEVFEAAAFGGCVFEVGADRVNVKACAVAEEAATLGGFEHVVAGVVVDCANLALEE